MSDSVSWQSILVTLCVAAVPAAVALWSALATARSAREARQSQEELARLQRLESRVSAQKFEAYSPILSVFDLLLRQGSKDSQEVQLKLFEAVHHFQTWGVVYASDEAVTAFGRLMQATFHGGAPETVILRLYADFALAARRDMADSTSSTTIAEILQPRIGDLYFDPRMTDVLLPFDVLAEREGWEPPWNRLVASAARDLSAIPDTAASDPLPKDD